MKIVIIGSVTFRKEMAEYRDRLNAMGHEGIVCPTTLALARGEMPELLKRINEDHARIKRSEGFLKWYYNAIVNADAVLVLNFDKNGINNYVGGNTLMEIGFAHVHDKKVFLLNPIPEGLSYTDEIKAMADIVVNGNLDLIK